MVHFLKNPKIINLSFFYIHYYLIMYISDQVKSCQKNEVKIISKHKIMAKAKLFFYNCFFLFILKNANLKKISFNVYEV